MLETMEATGNVVHSEFSCREENAKLTVIYTLSVMEQHGRVENNSSPFLVLMSCIQSQKIEKKLSPFFFKECCHSCLQFMLFYTREML